MKMCIVVFVMTLMSLNLRASGPAEGGVVRNGGDEYAIQFTLTANKLLGFIFVGGARIEGVDAEKLRVAVRNTRVQSTDQRLSLDGMVKDAINYPTEKRIVFNRKRWDQMSEEARLALVLHEYLGIMQVRDDQYDISKAILLKTSYGRVSSSEEVVVNDETRIKTWITGEAAKRMYDKLQVPSVGMQDNGLLRFQKKGQGLTCLYSQYKKVYSCAFEMDDQGVVSETP